MHYSTTRFTSIEVIEALSKSLSIEVDNELGLIEFYGELVTPIQGWFAVRGLPIKIVEYPYYLDSCLVVDFATIESLDYSDLRELTDVLELYIVESLEYTPMIRATSFIA